MSNEHPIIVLGAGPAGLAAARTLNRQGKKVIILEKETQVGGMSSSRRWNEFIIESGPHTYHVKKDRIDEMVREHYSGTLYPKKRNTRMLIKGKYFDYPLKFWQLVKGLNPLFSARMLGDFLYASAKYKMFPPVRESFESWGIKKFGRTLYDLCFGQYTERVWGIPPSRLSIRLASQKLHQLNLKDVLIKLLGGRGQEQATYWEDFFYPEEGMGIIFENMASRIAEEGGEIWFNSRAVDFSLKEGRLLSATVERDGERLVLPCSAVISAIPLNCLNQLVAHGLGGAPLSSDSVLRTRSLILVNLILKVPAVSDAHWIYLLDRSFRFNRFCEPKNLLRDRKPYLHTLITFELCCNFGDSLWKASDQDFLELAKEDIKRIGIMDHRRITDCKIQKVRDAYPIYDLGFERRLASLLGSLGRIKNLYSTGRQGLFLNTDMHDSMEMGLLAAEAALTGRESRSWYERMVPYLSYKTGSTNR